VAQPHIRSEHPSGRLQHNCTGDRYAMGPCVSQASVASGSVTSELCAGANRMLPNPSCHAPSPRAQAFALLVVSGTTILVGMIPALRALAAEPSAHLKAGSGGTRKSSSFFGMDTRSALVSLQVSLAVVLLFAASLMGTSVRKLLAVDEGFRSENLLTFDYSQPLGVQSVSRSISTTSLCRSGW